MTAPTPPARVALARTVRVVTGPVLELGAAARGFLRAEAAASVGADPPPQPVVRSAAQRAADARQRILEVSRGILESDQRIGAGDHVRQPGRLGGGPPRWRPPVKAFVPF
jgi:hypothetical protein